MKPGLAALFASTFLMFSFGSVASAQFFSGLVDDDPAEILSWGTVPLTRSSYIPSAVDLSPLMPPPASQGNVSSCLSFALGYATLGYYLAQKSQALPGHVSITPSPAYLHTKIRGRDGPCVDTGSDFATAGEFLKRNSLPSAQSVPYDKVCEPAIERTEIPGLKSGFLGFNWLFVEQAHGQVMSRGAVTKVKNALAAGVPVPISLEVLCAQHRPNQSCLDSLSKHRDKGADTYFGSLGQVVPGSAGFHAMVVVGYDDRKQAFKIQNSWGPDYADNGFLWMDYEAFKTDVRLAVQPIFDTPPRPPKFKDAEVAKDVPLDPCHSLHERYGKISGVVASFDDAQLLKTSFSNAGRASELGDISVRPWPVCAAHKTLEQPLTAYDPPKLTKLDGVTEVSMDGSLAFSVETPGFPSFLYVVYLQSDGSVVNLVPRGGAVRAQHPPNTRLVFGDGQNGRQRFYAVPPIGPEAIIAIAARGPIFELEELEDTHSGQFHIAGTLEPDSDGKVAEDQVFMTLLGEALAARPDPDNVAREISAAILHLTIKE